MDENANIEKFANAPSVLRPIKLKSPFLGAATALGYSANELKEALLKIDELLSHRKIEELRQAGEKLLQEAKSRESNGDRHNPCEIHNSFFRLTTLKEINYSSNYETTRHVVPLVGDITNEDIDLYSIITGENHTQIPLQIAQAIVEPNFWEFSLSEIRNVGEIIPAIPETIIKLPQIRVDEKRQLVIGGWNSNSAIELGVNWRERGKLICEAVRESSDDKLWSKESIQTNLVRSDDKYIWLSMEAPSKAALLCPELIQLKEHYGEVAECLKLWRADLGKPNDSSVRLKRWLESKPNAAAWTAHIAEMILVNFSPWPDPYHIRPQDDASRGLNSDKCLRQEVLPLFRELEKAPCPYELPNIVAKFISCIRTLTKSKPEWVNDAHGFPGEFSKSWRFKVRTRDHSYIKGEIVGEPTSTFISSLPLKFEEIRSGYGEPERFCISSGEIYCYITEEKDKKFH